MIDFDRAVRNAFRDSLPGYKPEPKQEAGPKAKPEPSLYFYGLPHNYSEPTGPFVICTPFVMELELFCVSIYVPAKSSVILVVELTTLALQIILDLNMLDFFIVALYYFSFDQHFRFSSFAEPCICDFILYFD